MEKKAIIEFSDDITDTNISRILKVLLLIDGIKYVKFIENTDSSISTVRVNIDGVVKLPNDICEQLGLENGGGIVPIIRKDTGHLELLTNEQFT